MADLAAGRDPGRKRHYIDAVTDEGRWTGKLVPVLESLTDPLTWTKTRRIFVNSMSDLFHESLPFEFIDRVFASMGIAHRHTFQILTKRADRMAEYFDEDMEDLWQRWGVAAGDLLDGDWIWNEGKKHRHRIERFMAVAMQECLDDEPEFTTEERDRPLSPMGNVWLGVSVENEKQKARIEHLRNTPSAVRFLSIEPLLEDVGRLNLTGIHWVIVGGESGPNARPMHPDWARSIRDQCQAAGVPFHFKQFGEYLCDNIPDDFTGAHANCIDFLGRDCAISYANGERWEAHAEKSIWSKCGTYDRRWVIAHKVGKKAAGRELDGRTWDEFPKAGRP